jgi:sulfur carrier protein ThiS
MSSITEQAAEKRPSTAMPKVILRFYEELNEYLPPEKHKRDFEFRFGGRSTVGEMIEQHGIPEDEVDLVLVNGHAVDFRRVLRDGDRVSVYPVFERFDIRDVTRLRERPLRNLKFVADKSLGKAAERLNDLGFDVRCEADLDTEEAMEISRKEKRILLTTRAEVAKSGKVTHVLHVAPGPVENQIQGILEDLNLHADGQPRDSIRKTS